MSDEELDERIAKAGVYVSDSLNALLAERDRRRGVHMSEQTMRLSVRMAWAAWASTAAALLSAVAAIAALFKS